MILFLADNWEYASVLIKASWWTSYPTRNRCYLRGHNNNIQLFFFSFHFHSSGEWCSSFYLLLTYWFSPLITKAWINITCCFAWMAWATYYIILTSRNFNIYLLFIICHGMPVNFANQIKRQQSLSAQDNEKHHCGLLWFHHLSFQDRIQQKEHD